MLRARSVSFGYDRESPLIREWSEDFALGEVVAVTGPSGSGKSTLLYLLGLMLKPLRGELWLGNHQVSRLTDHKRAKLRAENFGFVFQDAALDPSRTVLDNVLESALYNGSDPRLLEGRALGLLEEFGVEKRARARPGQVSGGQAQRIALSRALLNNPEVILADEPTGNLDGASSRIVLGALREQASRGSAVIIVTHDPEVVMLSDRTIRL